MRVSGLSRSLLLTTLNIALSTQETLVDNISFGNTLPLSKDKDGVSIPGFTLHSVVADVPPTVFSDRIQLTPPHPGNQRGAIWAEHPLDTRQWKLELEFRASGPERGSGNLQVWLVNGRPSEMLLSSLYTIEKFDGLGLMLDQYGGQGGALRGFLNDGNTNYRSRDINTLAFGNCNYAYRNLGRMTRMTVSQDHSGFEVRMDDELCFRADQIQLPSGYYFGVSAASAENADAFEIAKFNVWGPDDKDDEPQRREPASQQQQDQRQDQQQQQQQQQSSSTPFQSDPSSSLASASMAEFFTKLQSLSQKIDQLTSEVRSLDGKLNQRHDELQRNLPRNAADMLNLMAGRMEQIEKVVKEVKADVEGKDYAEHLSTLQGTLARVEHIGSGFQENLTQIVTGHAPRLGFFVFVILAFQVMLAGAYIVYKKRRANSPKKFL